MILLTLKGINVYHQSETQGDEIFIKYNKKKIWPVDERFFEVKTSYVPLNIAIELEETDELIQLELWEYDNPFKSDYLGVFNCSLQETELERTFSADLTGKGKTFSSYSMIWEINRRNQTPHTRKTGS